MCELEDYDITIMVRTASQSIHYNRVYYNNLMHAQQAQLVVELFF